MKQNVEKMLLKYQSYSTKLLNALFSLAVHFLQKIQEPTDGDNGIQKHDTSENVAHLLESLWEDEQENPVLKHVSNDDMQNHYFEFTKSSEFKSYNDTFYNCNILYRSKYSDEPSFDWQGACLETGADEAVLEVNQAKAYWKYVVIRYKPVKSWKVFKSDSDKQAPVGSIKIGIPMLSREVIIRKV